MKSKFPVIAAAFCLIATSVSAESIVINGRYIVPKDTVRAYFYRQNKSEKQTVFDVRWSDWSTQYACRDKYDKSKIEAASLTLVLKIAEARSLDFQAFLDDQGFTDCAKF